MSVANELHKSVPWFESQSPRIYIRIDYWEVVWKAIQSHRIQLPGNYNFTALSSEDHGQLCGSQEFYRVFSLGEDGEK